VDWIRLAEDMIQWQVLVNAVMKFQVTLDIEVSLKRLKVQYFDKYEVDVTHIQFLRARIYLN
jgi:hypothetical protein